MFGEERAAVVVSQGITPDEKRRFIAERVRVIQAKVLRGATPYAGGQQPTERAIRKTARDLNVSAATVPRAVAAESIEREAKEIADTAKLPERWTTC